MRKAFLLLCGLFLAAIQPALATDLIQHRTGASNPQGNGWHLAVSSEGKFSVMLPCAFRDVTINPGPNPFYQLTCTDANSTVYKAMLLPAGSHAKIFEAFEKRLVAAKASGLNVAFKGQPAFWDSAPSSSGEARTVEVKTPRGIFMMMAVYKSKFQGDADKFFDSLQFDAAAPAAPVAKTGS